MLSKTKIEETITDGLAYLSSMEYSDENGTGLCEKWITNLGKKSPIIRPDCTAEYLSLLLRLKTKNILPCRSSDEKCTQLARWCARSVTQKGAPFGYNTEKHEWESDFWVNDNAKVVIALISFMESLGKKNVTLEVKKAIQTIAEFLSLAQEKNGGFRACFTQKGEWFPPFVTTTTWGVLANVHLYRYSKEIQFSRNLEKGCDWLFKRILKNGRLNTTYELYRGEPFRENWRPPSSESAEFLILVSELYRNFKNDNTLKYMERVFSWVSSLQVANGAIINCDITSKEASEQNNPELADLVYTNGYALIGGTSAHEATSLPVYRSFSKKLAEFLCSIQIRKNVQWMGGWRGSYDVVRNRWAGRALYGGNVEEEGGMYSVYTGWTTAPILYGLTGLW